MIMMSTLIKMALLGRRGIMATGITTIIITGIMLIIIILGIIITIGP